MRLVLLRSLVCWSCLGQGPQAAASKAEFPFEYREGLLWVKVRVPESEKVLNFLLDSGAQVSVVNQQTAKQLGLAAGPQVEVRGVGVSMDAYWTGTQSAMADEVSLPNRFLALDLGKLSRSCERRVDGLIGADFLRGRTVQIDFQACKVRLLDQGTANLVDDVVPLKMRRSGMRVKASVNGCKPRWFRVDTGCATPLQWVTGRVSPNDCTSRIAVGLAEVGIPQTTATVRIGGEIFAYVKTGLHRSPIFEGEAGLVGNGLLSQFETITIDAPRGRLVLGKRRTPGI
jgi:hypothetical protein